MIPDNKRAIIAKRLNEEIGYHENLGLFVFRFAALDSGHDTEYALEILAMDIPDYLKKGIRIILEEVSK